jgi:hypothetical protein
MRIPTQVAGDAWLRDFEQSIADAIVVADTHLTVGQTIDGEVLPELAVDKIVAAELGPPIVIGIHLINEDGAVLAAMTSQVPLPIAADVEPPHPAPTFNRRLPNSAMHGLPSPGNIARQANVD